MSEAGDEEPFESSQAGCRFIFRDLAGNLVTAFVSREALVERAAKDDVRLDEARSILAQMDEMFCNYRLEIEGIARTKHESGMRSAGEYDVVVMDADLNHRIKPLSDAREG